MGQRLKGGSLAEAARERSVLGEDGAASRRGRAIRPSLLATAGFFNFEILLPVRCLRLAPKWRELGMRRECIQHMGRDDQPIGD